MKSGVIRAAAGGMFLYILLQSSFAISQVQKFDIPSEDAGKSVLEFARQAGIQIIAPTEQLRGAKTSTLKGSYEISSALDLMLKGTDLKVSHSAEGVILLSRVDKKAEEQENMAHSFKNSASTAALLFGVLSGTAHAQDATQQTESVVVTGSRIATNGNDLPTPVTIISAQQLLNTTPQSLPDGLNKLPEFDGSSTPNNAVGGALNGRGGSVPGNFLNLRGLGAIRTLILQDGQRVPGTFFDTTVDTDMLPQMLVQRVDVVKGGVSAVYGSDAVTGVVNFVTDTHFNGMKGLFQAGESTYNDARSLRAGLAWGMDVFGRGHIEASAEYSLRDAVPDSSTRPYGLLAPTVVGSGTTASPYKLVLNTRASNVAPGGLAVSGPFAGQQFLDNGNLAPFNAGTPTVTANVAVGGDGGYVHNQYLLPVTNKGQAYARFDYDITDDLSAYVSARYSLARNLLKSQFIEAIPGGYPITIFSGNPYLTSSEQATLTAAGTNSFQLSRWSYDLGRNVALRADTGALAISTGVKGKAWGDWNWDLFYTHGETRTLQRQTGNVNARNFFAAVDAVSDPATGHTVCRTTLTNPGSFPGCVPYNVFGSNNATQAAKQFVTGTTEWAAHNGLDDFGANLSGTAFEGWAGPVKVAAGVEYRLASLVVTSTVPDATFDPSGLRLAPFGTFNAGNTGTVVTNPYGSYPSANQAWMKPTQVPATGSENVTEGNVEFDAPLLKGLPLIQLLTVNGAYRYAQYSASGNGISRSAFSANVWKIGLDWQVFDDLRFRATRSRDFRAPTLWDLYQTPLSAPSDTTDFLTNTAGRAIQITSGNPALKAEVARNTTAGAVYTPGWFPGFSVSVDYFHLAIGNGIGQVNGLTPSVEKLCINSPGGSSPYCNLVVRPISYNNTSSANFPTLAYIQNLNVANLYAEGIDLEANYQTELSDFTGLRGLLSLRLLFSHMPTNKSQALPGATLTNLAGSRSQPTDKLTLIADYSVNGFTIDLMQRYYSATHTNSDPTLVDLTPLARAYLQTDLNFSYDTQVGDLPVTPYLNISNLFNTTGGLSNIPVGIPGLFYPTAPYADVVGRYFTLGVRFKY